MVGVGWVCDLFVWLLLMYCGNDWWCYLFFVVWCYINMVDIIDLSYFKNFFIWFGNMLDLNFFINFYGMWNFKKNECNCLWVVYVGIYKFINIYCF